MPLSKTCKCGRNLVFYARAGCWLCPEIEDTALAGLIVPAARDRSLVNHGAAIGPTESAWASQHFTCMPAELWDEDFEVTAQHLMARGVGAEDAFIGRDRERRELQRQRAKESIAKLPAAGPGSREQLNTYSCSDCGFRTPSDYAMITHLDREGHEYGEAPSGKRTQPSASVRTRPLSKEARAAQHGERRAPSGLR